MGCKDVLAVEITSLENYLGHIRDRRQQWGKSPAWFRGEPGNVTTPLLPKVYRAKSDGSTFDENQLLQLFRMKAPSFAGGETPPRPNTDQWLFLAQHVGLPTRLLDWTESALVGLYFALDKDEPVVWMLNPIGLNLLALPVTEKSRRADIYFPLTWVGGRENIGTANIKGAWELGYNGIDYPVAIHPSFVHPRMSVQRSVFTVHGAIQEPLCEIVPATMLRKYIVSPLAIEQVKDDLQLLGIHHSTAFPDLDGLARELAELY